MLEIDGSMGEGGGQVLRTALALSLVTGRPFRIDAIRAGRERPGLRPQHLAAVRAAAAVGEAEVEGAAKGSGRIVFRPRRVKPGTWRFAVGTAGSATLVLQTVLPALLTAEGPSRLAAEGGTHNPFAPPFDFLEQAYLPLLERMGPRLRARLERHGFYPRGGGRILLEVEPAARLAPLRLEERGAVRRAFGRILLADLPLHVAEREVKTVARRLGWSPEEVRIDPLPRGSGPGNAVVLTVESEHLTEVFSSIGERGVRAETVAARAALAVMEYLDAGVPVGEHLADQLLLPLALAGGGSFRTLRLSAHARTQIDLLPRFLDVGVKVEPFDARSVTVEVGAPAA